MDRISPFLSFTITRPADTIQYAAGDQIANSVVAGSVTPMVFELSPPLGRGCRLRHAYFVKSSTNVTANSFRLYLFNAPVTQVGDNNAWNAAVTYANLCSLVGMYSFTASQGQFSVGPYIYMVTYPTGFVQQYETLIPQLPNGRLYGILTATDIYTPTSGETFTIRLHVDIN